MKIAIVTNTSWNILNFRKNLIQELLKQYEVILVAPQDKYSLEIKELAPTIFLKQLERKGTNPINEYRLIQELKRIYKDNSIDLALHFTIKPNIYGSIAAYSVSIPSISVVTGLGYTFLSNGITAKVARLLYKYAFKRNTLTIFQNNDDKALFSSLNLVNPDKAQVIDGSGIDVDYFKPQPLKRSSVFKFLFVGRLLYDKGIQELFDAFIKRFQYEDNVELHIVGDVDNENPSAYSQKELDYILRDNPNIIYHGRVNNPKTIIQEVDCVVLPSYREGVPRVMLEAIAMEKPVITTDAPGCKETATNNNGIIVPVKNSLLLSKAMKDMSLLSQEERRTMGQRGRILAVQRFSTDVVNAKYLKSIETCLR